MVSRPSVMIGLAQEFFGDFLAQRERVDKLDKWYRGTAEDTIYTPRTRTREYQDLMDKATTPWASVVVTAVAQTMFVDGVRRGKAEENMAVWDYWQRNGWDKRQIALHRSVLSNGLAFGISLPSRTQSVPYMRPISAKRMYAEYQSDADDEWPMFAIQADEYKDRLTFEYGWTVQIFDDEAIHYLSCRGDGSSLEDWVYISYETHPAGVTPVVRYTNQDDLDGNAVGEIEPLIPMLRRIDQDTFDRLIVQRFGAWKVRYATGLARPDSDSAADRQASQLKVMDMLISENADTKFGTLPETQLQGFIAAGDVDLRYLAAVSQTPSHNLLGLSDNIGAEALAAAAEGLNRKSLERRTNMGESHEQLLRLTAIMAGNTDEGSAYDMEMRWRDTETRPLSQAADALSKLADSLGLPWQVLVEKYLPSWTDTDTQRAIEFIDDGTADAMIAQLQAGLATAPTPTNVPDHAANDA